MKLFTLPAIAALATLPAHADVSDAAITYDESGRGKVVDTVAYTVPVPDLDDMTTFNDRAQECVVRNVTFEAFTTRDTSRSFVGGYSGRLYQFGDTSVYDGDNQVIAFVSGTKPLVVGRGRREGRGIGSPIVQFTVALSAENGVSTILFEGIERAFQNSGNASNPGFTKVREAWGSGHKKVYDALDGVAAELGACMGS